MRTITFFNNKGGVGKTTLVYHLAWMLSELGHTTLVADLDPQANLTAMFLTEEEATPLLTGKDESATIYTAIEPLLEGLGDINHSPPLTINDSLFCLPGDIRLSSTEGELNDQWTKCMDRNARAFRVTSAFYRVIKHAAESVNAEFILIDVGPNLGAINRAAVLCSDSVITPLSPDLYSLLGMENLGPTLRQWRSGWRDRTDRNEGNVDIPPGKMLPMGYIIMQHSIRNGRPVKAFEKWMDRVPQTYHQAMLGVETSLPLNDDPYCLAHLKHYRSLMPLAQESRKPMFLLKASDGIIGGHAAAVSQCYADFKELAQLVMQRISDSSD